MQGGGGRGWAVKGKASYADTLCVSLLQTLLPQGRRACSRSLVTRCQCRRRRTSGVLSLWPRSIGACRRWACSSCRRSSRMLFPSSTRCSAGTGWPWQAVSARRVRPRRSPTWISRTTSLLACQPRRTRRALVLSSTTSLLQSIRSLDTASPCDEVRLLRRRVSSSCTSTRPRPAFFLSSTNSIRSIYQYDPQMESRRALFAFERCALRALPSALHSNTVNLNTYLV